MEISDTIADVFKDDWVGFLSDLSDVKRFLSAPESDIRRLAKTLIISQDKNIFFLKLFPKAHRFDIISICVYMFHSIRAVGGERS